MRCNTLAAAGKAEALLRRRLDAHAIEVEVAGGCNVATHLIDVRAQLRTLCQNRRIDIFNTKALAAYRRHRHCEQL